MGRNYEICGAKQRPRERGWISCNRKKGHTGQHCASKIIPAVYWKDDE